MSEVGAATVLPLESAHPRLESGPHDDVLPSPVRSTRWWLRRLAGSPRQEPAACHTRVTEVMLTEAVFLNPDSAVYDAAELLAEAGVEDAVVSDSQGQALGVISLVELLGANVTALPHSQATADDDANQPVTGQPLLARTGDGHSYPLGWGFHVVDGPLPTVRDALRRPAVSLPETASIARAAALMSMEDVSQLLVTRIKDGGIRGIVSARDITRWIGQVAGYVPLTSTSAAPPLPTLLAPEDETAAKSVLVVEDDRDICNAMVEILREVGYAPIQAPNGQRALELLRASPKRPGLILLDLMMPEMSGWEFREEQLKDSELAAIPVVVLTAHREARPTGGGEPPAALLQKPIWIDRLLDTVAQHYRSPN